MANAYTTFLNLTKPEEAADRDAWGGHWNQNADTIDTWAKGVADIVGHALRDDKDGITTGSLKTAKDFVLTTRGKGLAFGPGGVSDGYMGSLTTGGSTDLIPAGNIFRVVNQAGDTELFKVTPDGIYRKGGTLIFDSSNVQPGNYIDKTSPSSQTMAGPLAVNTYLDILKPNVFRARLIVDPSGNLVLQNGDATSPDALFYVSTAGAVYTKQLGDLNSRIEARAKAFADDRLATARGEYGGKFDKAGGVFTGSIEVNTNLPSIGLVYPGIFRWALQVDSAAFLRFINGNDGSVYMTLGTSGQIYTSQLGDLNSRIENRASAYANDALNNATARINNKNSRLAYCGDPSITQAYQTLFEPFFGGMITGVSSDVVNGVYQISAMRFRQLQMSDASGNWYACGYV